MEKKITRKQQAKNTKKKLLEVSMRLIKQYGFDAVTINQICNEADVSTGAFYHHLKSKAGIIIEGYLQCDEYFEEIVSQKLGKRTFYAQIMEYIDYQMEYAQSTGIDLMIQIYRAQITEGNQFFLSEQRGLPKGLNHLIQQAQENNELVNDIPYDQIGKELLIISRGIIYNWCQSEGSYPLIPLAEQIIGNYLHTYKKESSGL
ncbi:TetR/AcrR family transcriptional regulator [Oscillospiraceae bacterium PP1C4]